MILAVDFTKRYKEKDYQSTVYVKHVCSLLISNYTTTSTQLISLSKPGEYNNYMFSRGQNHLCAKTLTILEVSGVNL